MSRKILLIEDETVLFEAYKTALADIPDLEILTAATLLEALDVLEAHPDVALIAVDGCFPRAEGESPYPEPGRLCSGEKFIANARYRGPILACSSEPSLNERMMRMGATRIGGKGRALVDAIREVLASLPTPP